mgnify:CR=1 FL=1
MKRTGSIELDFKWVIIGYIPKNVCHQDSMVVAIGRTEGLLQFLCREFVKINSNR